MRLGKIHPAALIDHLRLQGLGQLHQQAHARRRARRAIHHDHRILRLRQQARSFFYGAGVALRRRGGHIARDIRLSTVVFHRLLLQTRIERNGDRPIGRRHRNFVGTHERLRKMLQ